MIMIETRVAMTSGITMIFLRYSRVYTKKKSNRTTCSDRWLIIRWFAICQIYFCKIWFILSPSSYLSMLITCIVIYDFQSFTNNINSIVQADSKVAIFRSWRIKLQMSVTFHFYIPSCYFYTISSLAWYWNLFQVYMALLTSNILKYCNFYDL